MEFSSDYNYSYHIFTKSKEAPHSTQELGRDRAAKQPTVYFSKMKLRPQSHLSACT